SQKPALDGLDALTKEFRSFVDGLKVEKDTQATQKALDGVRGEFGFTDEGMELVKKTMKDKLIADPRAAAALIVYEKPKPVDPSAHGSQRWAFLADNDKEHKVSIKELVNDPDAWLDRKIHKIINEERNRVRLPVGVI